ncbi:oxygen-independent coproporphyrinogen III oxidase [Microbulbifer rhizosphaerae]|uniref:Coproporphyrinogen-III oxidase n=1 Tax=Microbulbifer rhizosphaerae TaxID=1562603 RepID=A0A7W4W9F6_9GAMM|nr:oxygen-independent coproporphyrinogen III oxidase [Microbulbifer rhizosphaerae]MBB3060123.1 oxygen-independent coproporphyrinogen-3 oxidase [Microbulbifer rhizosphaerae]
MTQDPNRLRADLSPELLSRYSGSCPRYTSYPTADRFAPLEGAKPWLALENIRRLSLYVHIPFCHSLCYFCACNKVITNQYGLASDYLDCLLKEARWYRDRVASAPVVQLHLGGGTPTFLNDSDLRRLVEGLGEVFQLGSGDAVEYSIEADPRTLEPDTLVTLRELGFNRLSLGIQDFNTDVQLAINRICSPQQVEQLTTAARENGFRSISYDLIYGLPRQTVAGLQSTLDKVMELAPDRIALYHYAHLPHRFKAQRLIDTDTTPGPMEKIAMQLAAVSALENAGYEFLGMDHFALPGDELAQAARAGQLKRNFQGYTVMPADALVGLGASAISYSADGYWQNLHRLKEYSGAIREQGFAAYRGWQLSEDDRLRQYVVMELMCRLQLDKEQVSRMAGGPFDEFFRGDLARLQPLFDDGLVEQDRDYLRITPRGRWFTRNIASAFDAYLHGRSTETEYSRVL